MIKNINQNNTKENVLYNNILLLSRNKFFYTKIDLSDTFQNRIYLIFIHISFIIIKSKLINKGSEYKIFYQKIFDLLFKRIELNMREIGYGDVTINKNMKFLVKSFYNILIYCEKYKYNSLESKNTFFSKYLKFNSIEKSDYKGLLVNYFDKFQAFCFDLSSESVLKGELNFNYK